jgi:hypothetical protein
MDSLPRAPRDVPCARRPRRLRTNKQWEYVDVKEFHDTSLSTRIKYCFVYVFLIKNIAIYGLDIFTASTMLATDNVSAQPLPS